MSGTIPMRYNIIKQLIEHRSGLNPKEMYTIIEPSYRGEKQCSEKEIDAQLMSLKGTGMVDITETVELENGLLESNYIITKYGEERAHKYIGKYL